MMRVLGGNPGGFFGVGAVKEITTISTPAEMKFSSIFRCFYFLIYCNGIVLALYEASLLFIDHNLSGSQRQERKMNVNKRQQSLNGSRPSINGGGRGRYHR